MSGAAEAPLAVALAWLKAVDERDADALMALSAPDIELAGPRETARGRGALGLWFNRVAMRVKIARAFSRGGRALIEHEATWLNPADGSLVGEADIASLFEVGEGLVTHYAHDDDPDGALRRHGFAPADEVALAGDSA